MYAYYSESLVFDWQYSNCTKLLSHKRLHFKYNAYYLANNIIKQATYKSKQQVHICRVFLAFKHQPNQQANGKNEGHHQKLWSTRNITTIMVNWEVHDNKRDYSICSYFEFFSHHYSHPLA